ncbi:MAG: hypothetical protein ABSB78_01930 [Bacteroidota bacterium]
MKKPAIIAILCIALFSFSTANTVKSKDRGYLITIPDDWRSIPNRVISEVIDEVAKDDSPFARQKIEFAFQPKDLKELFTNSYILVEYDELKNPQMLRIDQCEKLYTPEIRKKAKGLASSFLPFTMVDSIIFSQKSNIIWAKAVTSIGDVPLIRMLAGFIPTSDGMLKIYCYSKPYDYHKNEKVFTQIIYSVAFQGEDSESSSFFESINIVKIIVIIIGAVFAGLSAVALKKNLT